MPDSDRSTISNLPPELRTELIELIKSHASHTTTTESPDDAPLTISERLSFDNQALAIAALTCATVANLAQRVLGEASWDHIVATLKIVAEAAGYSSVPALGAAVYCAVKARRANRRRNA